MTHPAATYDDTLLMVSLRLTNAIVSRPAYITWGCKNNTGGTNVVTLANAVLTAFTANVNSQVDTNVTVGPTHVILGDGTSTPLVGDSTTAPSAGTNAAASCPPNTAMLVKKITGYGGKKNRGRLYLPWFGDESIVDEAGIIGSGSVAGAQVRFTNFLAALATASLPMVVVTRQMSVDPDTGKPYVVNYHAGHTVTGLVVQALCGTQRRRMRP